MSKIWLAYLAVSASLLLMLSCREPFSTGVEELTNEPVAAALIVEPDGSVLGIGQSVQLRATPRAATGEVVEGYSITWETSDAGVVSVGEDGWITGVSLGSASVSATAEKSNKGRGRENAPGQLKKSKNVVVDPAVVATVEVDPGSATIEVGSTVQLAAIVRDSQGNVLENRLVTWSSSDPAIATVDGQGLVEGLLAGSAVVAAESEGVRGEAEITVTLSAPPPPPPPPPSGDLLPAFPGAEGWGAMALNDCRSLPLRVHLVSNRNNSGSGSFRSAIDATSPDAFDVIVFRTGGIITLNARIYAPRQSSCLYIAGQTAPGGGVLVRAPDVPDNILRFYNVSGTNNVVVRYMRMRHGRDFVMHGGDHCGGCRNLGFTGEGGGHRIIYDHLSLSWGLDGNLGVWRMDSTAAHTREFTVQRSLIAEPWRQHSTSFLLGGTNSQDAGRGVYQISVHHNLFANSGQRNPEVEVGDAENYPDRGIEIVNNVQYNWTGRPISGRKQSVIDIVNNYSKPGPATEVFVHRHMYENDSWPTAPWPDPSIHISGNVMEGRSFPSQWNMIRDWYNLSRELPSRMHRSTRLSPAPYPVTVHAATEAYSRVLADVGANRRLACDGSWVAAQDAVDARIIDQVERNSGPSVLYQNVSEAGGWPTIATGTPCGDADGDGLPDSWEERFFGCATCANPAAGSDSGYLVIEHYLNGTDPR